MTVVVHAGHACIRALANWRQGGWGGKKASKAVELGREPCPAAARGDGGEQKGVGRVRDEAKHAK